MIFININGVLCDKRGCLNENKLDLLLKLCNILNMYTVVLMGDLKYGWNFNYNECNNQVKDLLSHLYKRGLLVAGKTPILSSRDEEITKYLEMRGISSDYFVLDSDKSKYKKKVENCYFVDSNKGLIEDDILLILRNV